MKRTRQVFHYDQDAVPTDISGCRMFHGEDLRKWSWKICTFMSLWNFLSKFESSIWKLNNCLKIDELTVLLCVAFQDRMKHQAETQKQWVFEQKHEKNQIKNAETDEER